MQAMAARAEMRKKRRTAPRRYFILAYATAASSSARCTFRGAYAIAFHFISFLSARRARRAHIATKSDELASFCYAGGRWRDDFRYYKIYYISFYQAHARDEYYRM